MYAVFRSGGKQYRAAEGDVIRVEKIDGDEGASVTFDDVLLVGSGADITIGSPLVAGSAVTAKVLRQGKSRKVPVVKFRRRQNYLRQGSHRQFFTEIEIMSIGPGKKKQTKADSDGGAADKPAAKKAARKKTAKKKTAKKKAAKKAAKKKASKSDD